MSLAMILAFKDVENLLGVQIIMDMAVKCAIVVNLVNGSMYKFVDCGWRLYAYDITKIWIFQNKNSRKQVR